MRRRIVTRSTACRMRRLGTDIRNLTGASLSRRVFMRQMALIGKANIEWTSLSSWALNREAMAMSPTSFSFLYSRWDKDRKWLVGNF